ncbi:MAG: phosphate acyltransferase PlsX [Gammaproteobacteria bacterium]|nr:phosphate acyltransferase PlsX [Gammaproteobacteria bacterium]TVQ46248.1 MAG: phosphate acyltransferase PlsX [Gammaproteobacteria bacterium]
MSDALTIALDAMGGDLGPEAVVLAAVATLEQDARARLLLVGREEVLSGARERYAGRFGERLGFVAASEVVAMDESPREALRRKKDSSLRVAVDLVKRGEAAACVSAGNTGALMATAKFVLKTLPGVDRPAILAPVPTVTGFAWMLDLGANVTCDAENLLQFAAMGSVVAADLGGIEAPRVGLLNVGEEDIKGNDTVREAARLIGASGLNYIGFVEGNDIFGGEVDVVVTDGFTGNIALKTMEGLARMIAGQLREEFSCTGLRRLQALAALPALRALRQRLDPRRYNGASLVGLNGIVVKSHGSADATAFANAIRVALAEARKGVPIHISRMLENQKTPCIHV